MSDKSYYEDQLETLLPADQYGISVQFFGSKTKTKSMNLNEESARAIIKFFEKRNLIQPETNPELIKEFQLILEEQYKMFDKGMNCAPRAFRTVLAYLYWKDGAEWDFVEEVWFKDPTWTRDKCMKVLGETFNYGGKK